MANVSGIFRGPPRTWDTFMVSGTHTIPISLGILMGIVWVPLTIRGSHVLGGPWNQHVVSLVVRGGHTQSFDVFTY